MKLSKKINITLLILIALSIIFILYKTSLINVPNFEDLIKPKEIILVILASTITILAIFFTLSQFIVQKASEMSSPKILDEYKDDMILNFSTGISLFIISACFIYIFSTGYYNKLLFFVIVLLFLIILILLLFHTEKMIIYTSKTEYSKKVMNLNKLIKNEIQKESYFKDKYRIIQDITIKSVLNEEYYVVNYNIDLLYNFIAKIGHLKNCYSFKNKIFLKKYQILKEDKIKITQIVLENTIETYYQIYKKSLQLEIIDICELIIEKMRELISLLNYEDTLKIVFKKNSNIYSQNNIEIKKKFYFHSYINFLKITLKIKHEL
ncbi:hypothetical protein KQY27_03350 [Methanobrevibacter sp. TMH8]|uniref:hypothetical protein n=1 Tax=Methanobrevibacter sp. TMH8 TaxID=2848611 RepID=UPI001CCAF3F2|nr:hypothetical protein [Methanobrevibacter sp. TMH8]MBZ9570581.1 hypothetical protein [Methanobrevibacter sp. TMH8]